MSYVSQRYTGGNKVRSISKVPDAELYACSNSEHCAEIIRLRALVRRLRRNLRVAADYSRPDPDLYALPSDGLKDQKAHDARVRKMLK